MKISDLKYIKILRWHNIKKIPEINKTIILYWSDNKYTIYYTEALFSEKNKVISKWDTIINCNVIDIKVIKWAYLN